MTNRDKQNLIPSATVLITRDSPNGVEVFMVVRHHKIDFASGALVFPGGKNDPADGMAEIFSLCRGGKDIAPDLLPFYVSAARETYEECGVLYAAFKGSDTVLTGEQLDAMAPWRNKIHDGACTMAEFLHAEGLELLVDAFTPFAHWVTPTFMPKRFDTHFFLASMPPHQTASHDGEESVDSLWINPNDALNPSGKSSFTIIFPTRMNLMKLARAGATTQQTVTTVRKEPIVTVTPWIEEQAGKKVLCIPSDAGYGAVVEPMDKIL